MEVKIEKQKDGSYIAYNTEGTGTIIGTGETVAKAKADFMESLGEVIGTYETGETIPKEYYDVPAFKFDISSLFEYYSVLNVSAFARFVGINESLMRQYKRGDTYISDKQLEKIEDGIHRIGTELANLKLV